MSPPRLLSDIRKNPPPIIDPAWAKCGLIRTGTRSDDRHSKYYRHTYATEYRLVSGAARRASARANRGRRWSGDDDVGGDRTTISLGLGGRAKGEGEMGATMIGGTGVHGSWDASPRRQDDTREGGGGGVVGGAGGMGPRSHGGRPAVTCASRARAAPRSPPDGHRVLRWG